MSSVSLKDLSKAVTFSFTSNRITLPLPVELRRVIDEYVENNTPQQEQEANRLQEDMMAVFEKCVQNCPGRLAPFLRILRYLRPVFQGTQRSLQWWNKLSVPIMANLVAEKGLAHECRHALLEVLAYDADREQDRIESAQTTSNTVADSLLEIWLEKKIIAEEGTDAHTISVVQQVKLILTEYGKKKPRAFLELINKKFVEKSTRIPALSLLCDTFRLQPPRLHELMQTPLFDNLLQCLQIDTSTRVVSLGITALIMFLPHIPMSAASHLPALFNIYTRLLFWDRERNAADILPRARTEVENEVADDVSIKQSAESSKSWEKLSYLLDSDDDAVPELLHYFTFLYGLYPLNFMDYVRKPQRYLRHANFPGSDDLDIEPTDIRQRSNPYRQVHLLHPNFFTLTIESELSDKTRWAETDAADVVADCMSLYIPSEDLHLKSRSRREREMIQTDPDVPYHTLSGYEQPSPESHRPNKSFNVPETSRSRAVESASALSQDEDSYQIVPTVSTTSGHPLSDLLGSQSARSSLQTQRKDAAGSFALSDTLDDNVVNAYLEKKASQNAPQPPSSHSLRPTVITDDLKVKYLQRKVTLMQNDLNFERYLSQQYQSHIGRLRSEQIQSSRAESETQNLINTNRALRSKVEELKLANTRNKLENEKSKEHSRKWDGQVTGKLKALRDEQKQWTKERIEFQDEIAHLKKNTKRLRQIVVQTEAKELRTLQKMEDEIGTKETRKELNEEIVRLKHESSRNSAREFAAVKAIKSEQAALIKIKQLEMELESRDFEIAQSKKGYEKELKQRIQADRVLLDGREQGKKEKIQDLLDKGMAAVTRKNEELERFNKILRYKMNTAVLERNDIEIHAATLQDTLDRLAKLNPTPLTNAPSTPLPSSPILPALGAAAIEFKSRQRALSDSSSSVVSSDSSESIDSNSSDCPIIRRSSQKQREMQARERAQARESPLRQFESPQPFNPEQFASLSTQTASRISSKSSNPTEERRGSSSDESQSSSHGSHVKVKAPKIAPESKLRQFGRGGTQNVGLKDKAALKAEEERHSGSKNKNDTLDPEPKKAKRNLGLKGLRAFV